MWGMQWRLERIFKNMKFDYGSHGPLLSLHALKFLHAFSFFPLPNQWGYAVLDLWSVMLCSFWKDLKLDGHLNYSSMWVFFSK